MGILRNSKTQGSIWMSSDVQLKTLTQNKILRDTERIRKTFLRLSIKSCMFQNISFLLHYYYFIITYFMNKIWMNVLYYKFNYWIHVCHRAGKITYISNFNSNKTISRRIWGRLDMQIYILCISQIKINYTNTDTLAAHALSVDVIYI